METNIKLERYKGRPANKVLSTISMDEQETIIDALQKREDVDGTVGWLHLNQAHVSFFFIVLSLYICTYII